MRQAWSSARRCVTLPTLARAPDRREYGRFSNAPTELGSVYLLLASDEVSYVSGARIALTRGSARSRETGSVAGRSSLATDPFAHVVRTGSASGPGLWLIS